MVILGIETSCDETGIGIIKDNCLVSNLVISQEKIHSIYGGVVPELASRAHLENIDYLFLKGLNKAGLTPQNIDAIGVTNYPGLKGALLIGVSFASGLSTSLDVPLYKVNHLYSHIASNFLNPDLSFPAVGFVVSGGHTTFFYIETPTNFVVIGKTIDDACGETFDKVGRMLNLKFPGGPNVEEEAKQGDENKILFPMPLLSKTSLDFSFSGLKTSVLYYIKKNGIKNNVPDICAGFQKTVSNILIEKTKRVMKQYRPKSLLLGGGVMQNKYIQKKFDLLASQYSIPIFIPNKELCMDNGAMVAIMTSMFMKEGLPPSDRKIEVIPT